MRLTTISDSDIISEYQKRFHRGNGDFLKSSKETVLHLRSSFEHTDREQMIAVFLNSSNEIITTEILFTGTLTRSAIYPREIAKRILDNEAAAIILAHNHPSGNAQPSTDDITITNKIKSLCDIIDVTIHDHIIITNQEYYSMAEKGLI